MVLSAKSVITTLLFALVSSGQSAKATNKVAIIDAAFDTRPYLDRIVENDVLAIGRYYARCNQPELGLTQKRLVNQGLPTDENSEISEINKRGLGILSVYQYYNNSAMKFKGRKKSGVILPDGNCNSTSIPRSVEEEAKLDLAAALKQARDLGQPQNTAIYFGVDFNFSPTDTETKDLMVRYFRVIAPSLRASGYKVGAYGSGLALKTLLNSADSDGTVGLIDYAWISASRAFSKTSEFHRSGQWHLFQNQVDREWFGTRRSDGSCTAGLPLDTNVQNPIAGNNIGLWNLSGQFKVPEARTKAIFQTRRFACDGNSIIRRSKTSSASDVTNKSQCFKRRFARISGKVSYANSVHVGESFNNLVQVDADDDGQFDGWTWAGNLTKSFDEKPDWIFSASTRANKKCE